MTDRTPRDTQAPLLRKQVLDNPGAVDWFRAAPTPLELRPWLLLAITGLGVIVLVTSLALSRHGQTRHYPGTAYSVAGACEQRCQARIALSAADASATRLRPGDAVRLSGGSTTGLDATVVAVLAAERGGVPGIVVALPPNRPAPIGSVTVQVTREKPLYQWILPQAG